MAKVTRIKASDPTKSAKNSAKKEPRPAKTKTLAKTAQKPEKPQKLQKNSQKNAKNAETTIKTKQKSRKIFRPLALLGKPFVRFGRYVRDSWREIRQVRWPNRKTTWKMVVAVLLYTAIFITIIMLLDAFFTFTFNKLLK